MSGHKHVWERKRGWETTNPSVVHVDSECENCGMEWYSTYDNNDDINGNRYTSAGGYESKKPGSCTGKQVDDS